MNSVNEYGLSTDEIFRNFSRTNTMKLSIITIQMTIFTNNFTSELESENDLIESKTDNIFCGGCDENMILFD